MVEASKELRELRQQANYRKTMHQRAMARLAAKEKEIAELQQELRQQRRLNSESNLELEKAQARIAWLELQLFGNKSEKTKNKEPDSNSQPDPPPDDNSEKKTKRKRGQQPGQKSSGRKLHTNLPKEEVTIDLPEADKLCPCCGLPLKEFPGTEDSEEIVWEVRLIRRINKRKRYHSTCNCPGTPGITTAPKPPKLIPKGKFSIEFWVRLLAAKFMFQIPLNRVLKMLSLEGLELSAGTIVDNLQRISDLILPLYGRILARCREAKHWHLDETPWKVFQEIEGKKNYRWWLWIALTKDTVVYVLDPTRSGQVPKNILGDNPEGVANVDRYCGYKPLVSALLSLAYCWVHVRRDFRRVHNGYAKLRDWAAAWLERIDGLFRRNAQRVASLGDAEAFAEEDQALREELAALAKSREEELSNPELHPAARKVLESLRNHWSGLNIFVDNPEIPMDNNAAERGLRPPVVGRKNYYGSGSVWSGMFSAMMFTLFETLLLNEVDPQEFLRSYFEACARNGGRPPEDIEPFLPWNWGRKEEVA